MYQDPDMAMPMIPENSNSVDVDISPEPNRSKKEEIG